MTIIEIKTALEEAGIEFNASMKKAELESLLPVVEEVIEEAPAPEVIEQRIHEGKIVTKSEEVVLEGHSYERLHLIDGCTTIIPKA